MFQKLIVVILRFRWQTLCLSVGVTFGCWFLPNPLRFDGDILALLDALDTEVVAFRGIQERVPFLDALFVQLETIDEERRLGLRQEILELAGVSEAYYLPMNPATCHLLAVILSFSASEIEDSKKVLADISGLIGADELIGVTGTPAFLVESHSAMQSDIGKAGTITFVAILIFFVVFYRAGIFALLALIPVGIGIVWGLAMSSVVLDRLGLLAATVPTLMIGIGIDVSLHLLQATRKKFALGLSRLEAVRQSMRDLGRPIVLSGLSTAAAFLGLTFAKLKGLQEMGIAGVCLTLGVFAASIILVPIFLIWIPDRWLKKQTMLEGGMGPLADFVRRHSVQILYVFLILSMGSGLAARKSSWLSDQSQLEHPDLRSKKLQVELARTLGLSTTPLVIACPDRDVASSIRSVFHTSPTQWPEISQMMPVPGVIDSLILVHPAENPFRETTYVPLMQAIRDLVSRAGGEPVSITGSPVLNARLNLLLSADWWRVGLVSILSIVFMLRVGMGRFSYVFLALVPLAITVLWTAGILSILGISFSLMTVAVAPLVVGIGVDDGVHMVYSWKRHRAHLPSVFKETGAAVVATTVTTLAAFGSFYFSETTALVQFGLQGILGLTISMFAGLTILPLLASVLKSSEQTENKGLGTQYHRR